MAKRIAVSMSRRAVHFVGFRGDEYSRAVCVFGKPDFVHYGWDLRARREIADNDLVVFAKGPHDQTPTDRRFDDLPGETSRWRNVAP